MEKSLLQTQENHEVFFSGHPGSFLCFKRFKDNLIGESKDDVEETKAHSELPKRWILPAPFPTDVKIPVQSIHFKGNGGD